MTRNLVFVAALACTGCAAYRPLVDLQGRSPGQYEGDLADCQHYAATVNPVVASAVGASLGAGLGAALGAIVGDAGTGAALGAVLGGAQGLVGGSVSQVQIIQRCMAGRGYVVLQ